MTEQASWVPMQRRRVKPAKLPDALTRASRLIDWYEANKPSVTRLAVTSADYKAFEEAVGTHGISLSPEGVRYRAAVRATDQPPAPPEQGM